MEKVLVIGSPGAGKSTFSRNLSEVTKLPLYHLDLIYHRTNGTTITREEFDTELEKLLAKPNWILDGNYQRTLRRRLAACDTVILLDYRTEVCLAGIRERVGRRRTDFPRVATELDPELERKTLNFANERLPEIYELLTNSPGKTVIIFKTRHEADAYLRRLRSA